MRVNGALRIFPTKSAWAHLDSFFTVHVMDEHGGPQAPPSPRVSKREMRRSGLHSSIDADDVGPPRGQAFRARSRVPRREPSRCGGAAPKPSVGATSGEAVRLLAYMKGSLEHSPTGKRTSI